MRYPTTYTVKNPPSNKGAESMTSPTRKPVAEIIKERGLNVRWNQKLATLDDAAAQLAPLSSQPKLFGPLVQGANALSNSLGIKCVGSKTSVYAFPYEAIVTVFLMALSSEAHSMEQIVETYYGSYFVINLPASIFTVQGTLFVEIHQPFEAVEGTKKPAETVVHFSYEFKGQKYVWGQGTRLLNNINSMMGQHLRRLGL